MESTKDDSAIGIPGSPSNELLSNQDSGPPISSTTNQDTSAHSSIEVPAVERALTATSIGTKQAGITSAESGTQSDDQEQQPKSPTPSGKESKDSSAKKIARNCGTAISGKIIPASKLDGHSLHCRRRLVYSICYTHHISEDRTWHISDDSCFH